MVILAARFSSGPKNSMRKVTCYTRFESMRTSAIYAALGVLASEALVGGCHTPCAQDVCPRPFELLQYCAQSGVCSVDGKLVGCSDPDPDCPLAKLLPGATLAIPIPCIPWGLFGSQDALHIDGVSPSNAPSAGIDFTTATILFDGAPAPNCTLRSTDLSCANVPHSASTVSFSYGTPDGPAVVTMGANMSDDLCLASHPPCEN
jgi:hypothetical protein